MANIGYTANLYGFKEQKPKYTRRCLSLGDHFINKAIASGAMAMNYRKRVDVMFFPLLIPYLFVVYLTTVSVTRSE